MALAQPKKPTLMDKTPIDPAKQKPRRGRHEQLHDIQNAVYHEAEGIKDHDENFFYTAAMRADVRKRAKEILRLIDEHERIDAL